MLPCQSVLTLLSVPNAPCGVESSNTFFIAWAYSWFLMHRVELKDVASCDRVFSADRKVPNAPCGVERLDI